MDSPAHAIEVAALEKRYGPTSAVAGISFSIATGEVFGLLGPNGAGKTTVFYMITGLVPADTGFVFIDGRDVTRLPMYRRARLGIGYLPQEASIFRGLTVEQTHDNIAGIVQGASAKGLGVLLAGMEAPTNLGDDYRQGFRAAFARVAREQSPVFVPFLLEGVAGNPALNQADGIHPTAEGQRIIANLLYPKLRDMVDQISNTVR